MASIAHKGQVIMGDNGVMTFNGRSGSVLPMAGDYSAEQVNYDSNQTVKQKIDALVTKEASDIAGQQSLLKDTVGWTGKNLLKNEATTQTINGVTFTVNADGSVTANGTATADASLELITSNIKVNGTYILSGCPANGSITTYGIQLYTTNSTQGAIFDVGNGYNFVETDYVTRCVIRIRNGQTVSNLTFYPMIRKADITDPTYEPYHESMEGEIEQIYADNGVLGAKNWFKFPYVGTSATVNGIVYTVNNDGTVLANGTATEDANFAIARLTRGDFDNLVNKKYIMSGCPVGGNTTTYRLTWYQNKDGVQNWVHDVGESVEIDFTGANTYNIISVDVIVKKGTTVNNLVFKPMLRLASDPDDTYQPYAMTNRELTKKVFEKRVLTSADDLNDITETGIYKIRTAPVNSPESVAYVTLIVCKYDASDINQMIYKGGSSSGNIYIRSKGGSPSAWLPWYKFTGTEVS